MLGCLKKKNKKNAQCYALICEDSIGCDVAMCNSVFPRNKNLYKDTQVQAIL